MTPTADHARGCVLGKPLVTQSPGEGLLAGIACHIANDIHVVGRARWWDGRVCDPERDCRASDEHQLVREDAELARSELEQRDAHAARLRVSAAWSSRAATERTRTSPTRNESTRQSSRASSGCAAAAGMQAGCSGGSSCPRTRPAALGHTGGGSTPPEMISRLIGSAAHAAGTPAVSGPSRAGAMYRSA